MEIKDHLTRYGWITPTVEKKAYMFGDGSLVTDIIKADGQWDDSLPAEEKQYTSKTDTQNCTVYGSENVCETHIKGMYLFSPNYSDRYIGILAGTTIAGNDVQKVCETIRARGLIDEDMLPSTEDMSWDEYYSPKPMTQLYINEGKKWLNQYIFKHDWVVTKNYNGQSTRKKIMDALKYSPLGISVGAWPVPINGIIADRLPDNHWIMLYGFVEGKYWKVFDHYPPYQKKLAWDYEFSWVKRISVTKVIPKPPTISDPITEPEKKQVLSWLESIKQWLLNLRTKLKGYFKPNEDWKTPPDQSEGEKAESK